MIRENLSASDYIDYFKGRDWVHMLGFCAPDWKAFATRHHELFGSGPFFYTTNTFGKLVYHGDEVSCKDVEFRACYGGWGSHAVEVVQPVPFDAPTMFRDANRSDEPGFNHIHIIVEDLVEAQDACDFLGIPIVTVGYGDVENALKKAEMAGVPTGEILRKAQHPSFMVADMRKDLGTMVQLVEPSANRLYEAVRAAKEGWDGETDLFRKLG